MFLRYPLHKVWETDMTYDLDLWPTDLTINRDHLLIKDYLPTKFEASGAKRCWDPLHKVWETDMTFDLDLWPTNVTINRDYLLIKDYLPTKFEASGVKRSWVISCTRLRDTDIPTYRPTCATQYAPNKFFFRAELKVVIVCVNIPLLIFSYIKINC